MEEFWSLGEGLLSVACVPVGLTPYREGLYPLVPFNRQTAGEALDILERWGARWKAERGARTVYASDELYLLAGRPIPPLEFYEDFPKLKTAWACCATSRTSLTGPWRIWSCRTPPPRDHPHRGVRLPVPQPAS